MSYRSVIGPPLRRTPPLADAEAEMLASWLDWHRATLLDNGDHGLLRHMADVERWWFQKVFAGRNGVARYLSGDDLADVDVDMGSPVGDFEAVCAESRRIAADARLDDIADHPQVRPSLRWVMVHVIEEYARHNGDG